MTTILFNMRSSMSRTFKSYVSSLFNENMRCRTKCNDIFEVDNQSHLLQCQAIINQLSMEEKECAESVRYCDIFGPLELQWKVVKVMAKMLEIREK